MVRSVDMRRGIGAILWCAAAAQLLGQGTTPGDPPKAPADPIAITSYTYDEKTQELHAEGTAVLPQGACLSSTFLRDGNTAGHSRAEVTKGGRFELTFDAHGATFFPGKYVIKVEYRPQDQEASVLEQVGGPDVKLPPLEYVIQIGSSDEQKAFSDQAKKKLLDIMHELGRLYLEMNQVGGFTIASAVVVERNHKGVLPPEEVARLYKELDKFAVDSWEPRYRSAVQDFNDYKEQVAGGFLPEVETDLGTLLLVMEKWYLAFWGDVAKKLKRDPPNRLGTGEYPRYELEPEIETVVARVYRDLQVKSRVELDLWTVSVTIKPERGKVTGRAYESYASKFRVSLPNDDWKFDFQPINPSVRLRIIPKDEALAKKVAMAVEIRDFPESKGVEDLNHICEVFNSERWVGYKRISGKPIQGDDSTMPGGVRPGYEIVCLSDDKVGRYRVRDYALYCRWTKRTYSVLCMADAATFATYVKEFETTCKGFTVLDDPSYMEKALQEEKEEEDSKAGDAAHQKGGDGSHK